MNKEKYSLCISFYLWTREAIYSLCVLFWPFYSLKPKYLYFSSRRRRLYVWTLFLLFIIEIVIFVSGFTVLGNLILNKKVPCIAIILLLTALIIALFRLEDFSNYLKEQDKKEIREKMDFEIVKIKASKIDVVDFLITLKEENEVVKRTLESNKEPTLVVNLVNTALGFIGGYYFANIKSYEKIGVSPLIFLLIIFAILYSYFILDITKTSKLYFLELYNYQISYANRLIERYRK